MAETFRDLGEDALLDRLLPYLPSGPDTLDGPGDDCAVLALPDPGRLGLLKTDCIVERVHFEPDTDPVQAGWKVAARNLSDFAAMGGGNPEHALVTVVLPRDREIRWLEGLYEGIARAAARFGFGIAGGELSSPPADVDLAVISLSLSGWIEHARCIRRSGGRNGDLIWVTGRLGGSFDSGKHLDFTPRLAEARWLTAHHPIHAMMDLSDGLGSDLPRLARASGLGFRLDTDAVPASPGCSPLQAIGDGEDYELLFTTPPHVREALERSWADRFPGLELTPIGTLDQEAGLLPATGWDAFRSR